MYDELVETLATRDREIEQYETIKNGDANKKLTEQKALLAQAQRARDDAMRQSAEKGKQIERLTRELKKLGWTGWKKAA